MTRSTNQTAYNGGVTKCGPSTAKVIDINSKKEMEVKGMNSEAIKALESAGFKRWKKGIHDRLYISAGKLGLKIEEDIATFKGKPISVKEGGRMRAAKTYIDVHTGEVYSGNETLESEAATLVTELLSAKGIDQVV